MAKREKVLRYVQEHPGQSAYQVACGIGDSSAVVSSILYQEWRKGNVRRVEGGGPRGGNVYYPKESM